MKFCFLLMTLGLAALTHAQTRQVTQIPSAVYMVDLPIEYAYGERGEYLQERIRRVAEQVEWQFRLCGKDRKNNLSFEYYRPTKAQASARNQVLSEFRSFGLAMSISVGFDVTNKVCTAFIDNLHTTYGKNVRVAHGYTPVDLTEQTRMQEEQNACLSAKNECTEDVESYHCKYNVGSQNLVRNKTGELKAAILSRPSEILSKVCFFDRTGQRMAVMVLYNDAIENAVNE